MTNERVKILSPLSYKWDNSASAIDKNCYPPSLLEDLLEKYTCYFIDMSRATEKINNFARGIENNFKKQCDAHVYVCRNPDLNHPFGIHYDLVPNIIIQCEGQTKFKVWDQVKNVDNRLKFGKSNMKIDDELLLDVIMNPGDMVLVPEHYPHHAISITPRLSVSFPIQINEDGAMEDRHWFKFEG
tara:strand:- start:21 stop:575 length:555 start_codon:yes stop_codon:yes gene_type:complete